MNERIRELAEQARKALATDAMSGGKFDMQAYEEKFAELIVGECINCCDEVDRINQDYIKNLYVDPQNGPKECIEVIKAHFGVEE